MTGFYGQPPLGQSPLMMGANEGLYAQNAYGQGLPAMLPAKGLAQALQTTSYSPQGFMNSSDPSTSSLQFKPQYPVTGGLSMYARGGRVQREPSQTEKPLWGLAEALRGQGRHGDTILAHISPEEAEMLKEMGGSGTINPETGLPEYVRIGGFSLGDLNPFRKKTPVGKFVRQHLGPVIGTVLGNMILPGVGGAIGGGIGGSFGHPNNRMGPVKGAMMSQMYSAGLNALGSGANALGMSGIGGSLQSLGGPNYLSSLMNSVSPSIASHLGPQAQLPGFMQGIGSFFGGGGGSGGSAAASTPFSMNPVSQLASTLAGKGASSAAGGGLGSFLGGNMLNNALLATAIGGTLLRREKPQGPQSIGDAMTQAEKHRWRPDQYPDKNPAKAINRKYKGYSPNYRPGFDPEEEAFEEDSPWQYPQKFSEGGFLEGESPGQQDNVPALLSEGEFVIPADVVSDLGDGNSKAGAKRLNQLISEIRHHKNTDQHPPKAKGLGAYLNA
ncbi:hypothetical protein Cva_00760 [Caedimonas varicaedens]|uniref:Uncharacterized protein n=1 Tax=Caedimonas varicaedens TaxID=1629334 RepID=A0A0K8MCA7_9PROT|nr:hypothetical protein Cva_00760 [Caedimonas varicaedens]